jgi:hypothetical protein
LTAKRIIRTQLGFDLTKINQLTLSTTLKEYLHAPFDKKSEIILITKHFMLPEHVIRTLENAH